MMCSMDVIQLMKFISLGKCYIKGIMAIVFIIVYI